MIGQEVRVDAVAVARLQHLAERVGAGHAVDPKTLAEPLGNVLQVREVVGVHLLVRPERR